MTQPLYEYMSKYSGYKQFLGVNVAAELKKIEEDETKEIKEIKQEIQFNRKREQEIKTEIIEKIQVGLFEIETREICEYLTNKYVKIATGLQRVIGNRITRLTVQQLQQFNEIQMKIRKNTNSI